MVDRRALIAAITLGIFTVVPPAYSQEKSIVVASTTSAQDSGLFEYLLPIFKQKTGVRKTILPALRVGRMLPKPFRSSRKSRHVLSRAAIVLAHISPS